MDVFQIEKILDWMDNFENLDIEQKAELISTTIYYYLKQMKPEEFKQFFKTFLLNNPEILDDIVEHFRKRYMKMLREALKRRKRDIKIKRL